MDLTELADDHQLILNNNITTSCFWWDQDPIVDMLIGDHHQTTAAPVNPTGVVGEEDQDQDQDQDEEEEEEELGAMKEMMYKVAAMQPVNIDPTTIHKPKRRNVRISDDPQSVAARRRRERISEKMRILQRLVPGGTKMDTASMLDEAVRYLKFLKRQIKFLQTPTLGLGDHHQLILNTTTTTHTHDHHWPPLFFDEVPPSNGDHQIYPHPHYHP